ncbi:helix-turn-helix domain-containing protein [Conexibacter woesei]|uniref:Transcriptional regulator, PucR family n=1 Tax=Conexibacter woesei (strain DSM 14684 / CCUG 47730 / CIP 108061 / JCM 11494 / NBRC 100937 / ID131577) TaxID=469383 RepID=D3F8T5_CONWI|nr:helix-turn-helix domain-containing protein [Conexibacter woesei]ADB51049.1 transcriptional regulator, PucR family [Conexibacter woesei DSM 14684]
MQLTLGNLLDERELGLTLVTSDASARERPVRGAHAIEVAAPTRWIPEDWVMLTNGLRVRGRGDDQRRLIAELDDGGQTALGWAVGLVLQRVPQAIVDEAERRAFPVFLVPIETAFHQIISFLHDARTSEDMVVMRRIMSMEEYLMDALQQRRPERAIVSRLASLLDVDALLATGGGEVLEASGRVPAEEDVRAAIGAADDGDRDGAQLGGRAAAVLPLPGDEAGDQLLIVSGRRAAAGDPLARPVIRRAAQLLGLVAQGRAHRDENARARGADVLRRALRGIAPAQAAGLDAEVSALGLDFGEPVHVVAWSVPAGVASETAALALVRELLSANGLRHLLTAHGEQPVTLVQGDPALLAEALLGAGESATPGAGRPLPSAGVGRRIDSLRDARRSLHDARLALAQARATSAPDGTVVRFDQLDPVGQLLAAASGEEDGQGLRRLAGLLDPIRDQPHLLATLSSWIDCGQNSNETAARLHLHRNSLRYRLARIEELLGVVLETPRGLANVQLALLADELDAGGGDAAGER